jgi:hypothetical protein
VAKRGSEVSVAVRSQQADRRAADLVPTIRELQAGGASLRQVAAELTRRNIPTPGRHLERYAGRANVGACLNVSTQLDFGQFTGQPQIPLPGWPVRSGAF